MSIGGPQSSKNGDIMYCENVRQIIATLDGLSTTTLVQEYMKAGRSPNIRLSGEKAVFM